MASMTSRIRTRLDSLWKEVLDGNLRHMLHEHNAVPDDFLREHKIRVIPHIFEMTDDESTYLNRVPPILFAPSPKSVIDDHPIDVDECIDPLSGKSSLDFQDYSPPKDIKNIYQSKWSPIDTSGDLFRYLGNWTFHGFPRKRMPIRTRNFAWSLSDLSYILPVSVPHSLFSGPGISGGTGPQNIWDASVYEYKTEDDFSFHPHVILLSYQSDFGHDGSIMYGELVQLITAMRNRAQQPVPVQEKDDVIVPESPNFYFKHEQRFPVLMVSCVGPQHARIYYTCMDG